MSVVDFWSGNAKHGQAIINGFFFIYDKNQRFFQMSWSEVASIFSVDSYFASYTCGFSWIRDLKATGDMSARRLARRIIEFWIDNNLAKKTFLKEPQKRAVVAAMRLSSWLTLYDFFGASAQDSFKKKFLIGIQREYNFIKRRLIKENNKLIILKALIEYNVYLDYDPSFFKLLLYEIIKVVNFIEGENNFKFKSISKNFNNFCIFIELRNTLRQWEKTFSHSGNIHIALFDLAFKKIQKYLQIITPVIRFYRHSNGVLCNLKSEKKNYLFQESILAGKVDTALSQIEDISLEEFFPDDILRFSDKQSVLFIDLNVSEPKKSNLNEYGKNFADSFLNFEWSVNANNIINKNSSLLFQKNKIPIFLKKNLLKNEKKKILHDFSQKNDSAGVFFFNGILHQNETTEGSYFFSRELRLFSQDNLLCGSDIITMLGPTEEALGILQFNLGKNLKVVEIKHTNDKGYIIYNFEPDFTEKVRKNSKKSEKLIFVVISEKPFFVKNTSSNNQPVITVGYSLEGSSETQLNWSFQLLK
jgi:hypothetical protein